MEEIMYIEETYLIAYILKYKDDDYLSFDELYYISNLLNKEFEDKKVNARIIDDIDWNYYHYMRRGIRIKETYNYKRIIKDFFCQIKADQLYIVNYLDNEELILNLIINAKQSVIDDEKKHYQVLKNKLFIENKIEPKQKVLKKDNL